jgi:hypothetical protein
MVSESTKVKYEIAKIKLGESVICPRYSVSGVTVTVRIDSLQAERTGQYSSNEELFFDVNAKLDEQKKSIDQVALSFNLSITTKPNIVKYSTAGVVTLEGDPEDIKKRLEANPKTKIPQILFTVYQHVFNSIYILASILNTPYPPPDLLHPMAEKIQILPSTPQAQPEGTEVQEQPMTGQPSPQSSAPPPSTPEQPAAQPVSSGTTDERATTPTAPG